jgi:hypothetical protein
MGETGDGYTLRELCVAGSGFAPGSISGVQKVIVGGRQFTLDDRFVPFADYAKLRAECERLRALANGTADNDPVAS